MIGLTLILEMKVLKSQAVDTASQKSRNSWIAVGI